MDPLADMLIRIKNAGNAGKESVAISYSKLKFAVANELLKGGYLASVNRRGKGPKRLLEIDVAYEAGKPRIHGVKRISKLSRRIYMGLREIPSVRQGYGDIFLSTPKGILTGKEARKEKIGGEALFSIW